MKKIIVPIFAILFMNCEENELTQSIDSAKAADALTEYVTISKVFQDLGNNSGDAVLNAENSTTLSKSSTTKDEGPVVTISPLDFTTFPKTITIDYQTGVLCQDGITRRGVATIVSTGWYGEVDSQHTTTFSDYYHEDFKVEGIHIVKNLGKNEEDNLEYSVVIQNGKITTSTGETINYTENSTRTWVVGIDTPLNIWDDEYLLDGVQTGTSSKDVDYTLTTEEPLHFDLLPRSIKSGILDVDVASIEDIKINYTEATITILGKTYEIGN